MPLSTGRAYGVSHQWHFNGQPANLTNMVLVPKRMPSPSMLVNISLSFALVPAMVFCCILSFVLYLRRGKCIFPIYTRFAPSTMQIIFAFFDPIKVAAPCAKYLVAQDLVAYLQ